MAQIGSVPQILQSADIFSCTEEQEINIGAKAFGSDGSTYRYVQAGGTSLLIGKVIDAPASIANHTNLACAVAAIGASTITVTLGATAVTANQYAGGYIGINDATGQGYTYSIEKHPAAEASADVVITLVDAETVQIALDATSQASLVHNQYNGAVIHASTEVAVPIGVSIYPITANYYGWIKSRGVIAALCGATTGIGLGIAASDTRDGAYEVGDGILAPIGTAITAGVDNEFNMIMLQLD